MTKNNEKDEKQVTKIWILQYYILQVGFNLSESMCIKKLKKKKLIEQETN